MDPAGVRHYALHEARESRMRTVLIVDDNLALAENLAEILADAGVAHPVVASSGEQALALVAETRFDVMVTDMRMPGMNGAELIHRVRAVDPDLPILIMSAFTADKQLADARHDGVLSVLTKPTPIPRLLELVARAHRGMVALVEDDVALADNLVEALRERGFTTVVAHSVGEAARLGGAPCVAIVDVRVPGGEDGAAIAQVRGRFPGLPVIVVTAYRDRVPLPAALPVLEKPVDTARLLDTIERVYARRAK